MIHVYVLTEGSADAAILQKLLPDDLVESTQIVAGSGSYSARSLARTILATRQMPMALIVAGETEDDLAIREQRELLRFMLRQVSAGTPCEAFVAVPEVEAVLLPDKAFLEELLKQPIADADWERAKHSPGEFLRAALNNRSLQIGQLLDSLTEQQIAVLRNQPFIEEITQFLSAQIYGAKPV